MIKQLLPCLGKYKKDAILSPIFITLEVIMDILIPLLMADLIDFGIDMGNMGYVVKYGLILVVMCGISLVFGALSGRSAAIASTGFGKNLRQKLYHKVQDFSFSNIDKFSSASIVTRLTTDVSRIQESFMMIIRIAVRAPVMLILSVVASYRINKELAGVFLWVLPLLAISFAVIMVSVHPLFRKGFKVLDRLNQVVQENVRGIRVVKTFVRKDHEIEKIKEPSGGLFKLFRKADVIIAFNSPLMTLASAICILAISWLGARIIVTTGGAAMSTGDLMSLLTYVLQMLMNLMMLSMITMMIILSRASVERVCELLQEQPDIRNPEHPVTEVADGSITFENVRFAYSKDAQRPVLENVNLSIAAGETIGILGGTGSSKTSLVQLIPRLYDVQEGSVKVGGVDVRDYDLHALRDAVSMVLQKNVLFSGTIKDNLRWGDPNATDEDMERVCKLAQADGFIREFPDGYDTMIDQGGTNVSGGQRQRLCIARALLKKPKVLILDDSTSAVDTRTDALIRHAFAEEIPDTTKLIISQRVSSVQDADHILILDGGKVCGFGTHEELLRTSDIYREVYESQTRKEVG